MWFTCCQCWKRFEVLGELAEDSKEFYARFPDHTEDKQIGVCDSCWLRSTGRDERIENGSVRTDQ